MVLPSLAMNYLGQGALVIADPKAIENPFFLMYPGLGADADGGAGDGGDRDREPGRHHWRLFDDAQAIQLGLLPRFEIRHTSEAHSGQIYMPRINMLLLLAVILLVLLFRSSSALASAYGIAVTGTMVVTAMMGFVVIWRVWKWSPIAAAALIAPFLLIDITFLARQPAQGVRGRLGAAGAGRHRDAVDVHMAARQPAVVREDRASWNSRSPTWWRCWRSARRSGCPARPCS